MPNLIQKHQTKKKKVNLELKTIFKIIKYKKKTKIQLTLWIFLLSPLKEKLKMGKKKVKQLKKGDILSNGAIVECLVENKINKYENVVNVNNVYFSLYHPIEINGEWIFPCEHFKVTKKFIDCWYNLVLKKKHEVILNGVKAITLGHNRKDGILKHPYFGTNKVIDALKKYNTFNSGFISTSNLKVHRTNNLIDQYY